MEQRSLNDKVEEIRNSGTTVDIGGAISKAWKIHTSMVGQFILFYLLLGVIGQVVGLIPFGSIVWSLAIAPPLTVGIYYAARQAYYHGPQAFKVFTEKFQEFYVPAILNNLVIFLVSVAVISSCIMLFAFSNMDMIERFVNAAMRQDFETIVRIIPYFMIPLGVSILPLMIIGAKLCYVIPFIARGASFSEAFSGSWKLSGGANFFPTIGLIFMAGLISISGILGLIIGILFTIPLGVIIVQTGVEMMMEKVESQEGHDQDAESVFHQ